MVLCTLSAISHITFHLVINMIQTCVLMVPCPLTSTFDDQLAQRAPGFECSFASGFDVNANSTMGKLCTDRRSSVAKTCSAVPGSCHASVMADCAGLVATSFLKNRSDRVHSFAGTSGSSRQSVGLNGCVRQKTWRMRRRHELCPLSCIDRSQRSKSQVEKERRKKLLQSVKEPHR